MSDRHVYDAFDDLQASQIALLGHTQRGSSGDTAQHVRQDLQCGAPPSGPTTAARTAAAPATEQQVWQDQLRIRRRWKREQAGERLRPHAGTDRIDETDELGRSRKASWPNVSAS